MMRLPRFAYHAPRTLSEAVKTLAGEGPEARLLAGGTDLLPNMKRRQQTPKTVIGLRSVEGLRNATHAASATIGAGVTLTDVVQDARIRLRYPGLWQAAAQVATPHLRNMATIGGNLCLDTRCHYYDQTYEWRKAIDFCMKKDGETCWVAPGSPKCLAVSSTDTGPALVALNAHVRLVSDTEERVVALEDFYREDGIDYMKRRPDEILSQVMLEPYDQTRSAYWKLRRRGAFDFPVLSAAVAVRFADDDRTVESARVVLGAVGSQPRLCDDAGEALAGKPLTDDAVEEAADLAAKRAKPMDNVDFTLHWRKRVAREFVSLALREVRGDDVREARVRYARHSLEAAGY